jgi:FkbM family methyltransferase
MSRTPATTAPANAPAIAFAEVVLPWGDTLRFLRHEQTGLGILRRGLFDLTVSEGLYRLADSGELVVDVGGNVGHMTSVLSRRVGRGGTVLTFEPHPVIHEYLVANVRGWAARADAPEVVLHRTALSNFHGTSELVMSTGFDWNQGTATLEKHAEGDVRAERVDVRRLDDVLGNRHVGVMKIDVEGHERAVLEGAERALADRRIRDVVFEDFDDPPTAVARLLQDHGYEVFSLDHSLLRPVVGPATRRAARLSGADPSYLATADPRRAIERLSRRGWAVLGVGPAARAYAGGSRPGNREGSRSPQ